MESTNINKLSAITTFSKQPKAVRIKPDSIRDVFQGRCFFYCVKKDFGRLIGPAVKTGKKER